MTPSPSVRLSRRNFLCAGSYSLMVPMTSPSVTSGTTSTELRGQLPESVQRYGSCTPSMNVICCSAMARRVDSDAMCVPGRWWSEPWPTNASTFSVSVIATAPTPSSSWMILAISGAISRPKPRGSRFRVRSAMRSARALEAAPTWSWRLLRSRRMLMNTAVPSELATIIGSAMTFTSATASGRGRATRRMIAICSASATTVVENASFGPTSRSRPARRTTRTCTRPATSPSAVVDSPHANAVNPPSR